MIELWILRRFLWCNSTLSFPQEPLSETIHTGGGGGYGCRCWQAPYHDITVKGLLGCKAKELSHASGCKTVKLAYSLH